jgi:hypothetical protein
MSTTKTNYKLHFLAIADTGQPFYSAGTQLDRRYSYTIFFCKIKRFRKRTYLEEK